MARDHLRLVSDNPNPVNIARLFALQPVPPMLALTQMMLPRDPAAAQGFPVPTINRCPRASRLPGDMGGEGVGPDDEKDMG